MTMALVHVGFGSTILLAVLARLYLRYRFGAPGHAPGTSPMQAKVATAVHWSLYGTLIGMVITGGMTWNGVADLGYVHWLLNLVLFGLITAHAAAAIFNQFVRKDGTLRRMIPSRRT
ncbi:cytochrome b/b6 domain-containing protein, partial [Planktotalea sp.]|uniref:cytochrome b n=1 Tax=Planktotalea sp. TaxID=2029877 RepID=UPI003296B917